MQSLTTKIGIPLYILEDSETVDNIQNMQGTIAYVVCGQGIFVYNKNPLFTSMTPLDSKSTAFGKAPESSTKVFCGKISEVMFESIKKFMLDIYEKYKSEVAILLYYNPTTSRWAWSIPKQTVSAASAHYNEEDGVVYVDDVGHAIEDISAYTKFGSIHSHASMGAFHSGTDNADEFNFNGLHMTIGNFNTPQSLSFSTRWILSGKEHKVTNVSDVVGRAPIEGTYPPEIIDMVSSQPVGFRTWDSWSRTGTYTRFDGYNNDLGGATHNKIINRVNASDLGMVLSSFGKKALMIGVPND